MENTYMNNCKYFKRVIIPVFSGGFFSGGDSSGVREVYVANKHFNDGDVGEEVVSNGKHHHLFHQ